VILYEAIEITWGHDRATPVHPSALWTVMIAILYLVSLDSFSFYVLPIRRLLQIIPEKYQGNVLHIYEALQIIFFKRAAITEDW
jgi:hypothetical protein